MENLKYSVPYEYLTFGENKLAAVPYMTPFNVSTETVSYEESQEG